MSKFLFWCCGIGKKEISEKEDAHVGQAPQSRHDGSQISTPSKLGTELEIKKSPTKSVSFVDGSAEESRPPKDISEVLEVTDSRMGKDTASEIPRERLPRQAEIPEEEDLELDNELSPQRSESATVKISTSSSAIKFRMPPPAETEARTPSSQPEMKEIIDARRERKRRHRKQRRRARRELERLQQHAGETGADTAENVSQDSRSVSRKSVSSSGVSSRRSSGSSVRRPPSEAAELAPPDAPPHGSIAWHRDLSQRHTFN